MTNHAPIQTAADPYDPDFEPYNDSDGEPDFTLEDDEEFEESLAKALRWPNP